MQARRASMHASNLPCGQLTRAASKAFFLDQQTHPRILANAKFCRGRHPASPNYLPRAFEHGPTNALLAWDSLCLEHLLELPALSVAARSIGVARPPTP